MVNIEINIKVMPEEIVSLYERLNDSAAMVYNSEPTCKLIKKLEGRVGVRVHRVSPYEPYEIKGTGPAIILVVED